MKLYFKKTFALPMLAVALVYGLAGHVTAQTLTTLYSFSAAFPYTISNALGVSGPWYTNSDGFGPNDVILSGDTLYGTTFAGGAGANGTVFKVNTNGTGFTVLHSFMPPSGYVADRGEVNSDGANPNGSLILSGNTLYGTASQGGNWGGGTVFAVNTDGTGFKLLHTFVTTNNLCFTCPGSDGNSPFAGPTLLGNTLYGTTAFGGASGNGTVFKINTDGTGYGTLYSFEDFTFFYANTNGAYPYAGLILSGDKLYGTTTVGGDFGLGTVFAVNTNGTGFTNLHSLGAQDGVNPWAPLMLWGNTLYGTTAGPTSSYWSNLGNATVFKLNIDGTGFTVLHAFTGGSDGRNPYAGLILSGNTLCGTTAYGGNGFGTVFGVNSDSTGFTTLHSFTNSDGAFPFGPLIIFGNTLYGAAYGGGSSGRGTIFSITLAPPLTIAPAGGSVIVTWPTNFSTFALQSTTNLASPVWTTNLPAPVVVSGQYTVTNAISGRQQFFRLSQ
jgi:uncharacterized repeat protein (TIGR03803 family)